MCAEPSSLVDGTLVKALARAHRWQGMLDGGEYGSIEELAKAERINPSNLARLLRLALLALEIVESILDGRDGSERINLSASCDRFRFCGASSYIGSDRPLRATLEAVVG